MAHQIPNRNAIDQVAIRYVDSIRVAAGSEQDITRNLQDFRNAYTSLAAVVQFWGREDVRGGVLPFDAKLQWVVLIKLGRRIADGILSVRSIPRQHLKGMEMAYRLFENSQRPPKDFDKWWKTNEKRILLLMEGANSWPAKVVGGDELFTVGSFRVHNTIGATGKDLDRIRRIMSMAEKAAKTNPARGFARTLYGDIHVVSRIAKAHHAAWYYPSEDSIYLRMLKESDGDIAHSLVHELGHRYWKRFAGDGAKREWYQHHSRMDGKDVVVTMPSVGDVIPVKVVGQKGDAIIVKEDAGVYHVKAPMRDGERVLRVAMVDVYKVLRRREKVLQNFPTVYSSTDGEEHFCDALALLAFGKLQPEHHAAFTHIWK